MNPFKYGSRLFAKFSTYDDDDDYDAFFDIEEVRRVRQNNNKRKRGEGGGRTNHDEAAGSDGDGGDGAKIQRNLTSPSTLLTPHSTDRSGPPAFE